MHDCRNVDLRKLGEIAAEQLAVPRLLQVVELVLQGDLRLLDRDAKVHLPSDFGVLFERRGDVGERVELFAHCLANVGPLDLDDYFASIAQNRAMDLTERGGSDGLRLELLERFRDADLELL